MTIKDNSTNSNCEECKRCKEPCPCGCERICICKCDKLSYNNNNCCYLHPKAILNTSPSFAFSLSLKLYLKEAYME